MVPTIFMRLYRWLLHNLFAALPATLAPNPTPDELTTRHLYQASHFVASKVRVKPHAFHPSRQDHKTSVFRITGLTEKKIWLLGDIHVAAIVNRKILARAEVSVAHVQSLELRVEQDEPPRRHANIAGWASEKDRLMSQAQELAELATLRLPSKSA